MFPVEICEIHSLGRYSREVFVNRCSSAYRTPEMDTRERKTYAVAAQSSIVNFLSIDGFVAATASLALSAASLIAHKQGSS